LSSFLPFNDEGYLYPGIYYVTWADFTTKFGSNDRRRRLLQGLHSALTLLARTGCKEVYLGGSFVTLKEFPNDFDGCFDVMAIEQNLLDPIFLDLEAQRNKFNGEIKLDYMSFLQNYLRTDRSGNSIGIIALNPQELIEEL
jgi:hypothetical protein